MAGILVASACESESSKMQSREVGPVMDADTLGQKLQLKLPTGTEVVGVETEAGIDDPYARSCGSLFRRRNSSFRDAE